MVYKIVIASFLCFLSNNNFGQEITKSNKKRIDSIFKEYNNTKTPGVAVAFLQNEKIIFAKSYGMADLEHSIPISSSSVFSLASVSKQFTVFAILLLEEQGKLSLNDDIRKYLPAFKNYGRKITIKNLANHSSGIRDVLKLLGKAGYITDNIITKNDVHRMIYNQKELNFPTNTAFSYSNSGYVLLAEIVEKVSRKSFPEFLKEHIFIPLKMNDSFVMDNYHQIVKNRANSYEIENQEYVNAPANYSYYGSSGLFTTINDLAKWTFNFSNHKVGNKQIFDKMSTLGTLDNGDTYGYGLGQFVGNFNGLKQIYHAGAAAGYRAYLGRFPEINAAILLLSNNNTLYGQGKALELANVFLEPYYKKEEKQSTPKKSQKILQLPTSKLKKYVGSFLNSENYLIRNIILRNDTLIYSRPDEGNRETSLLPLSKNTFQLGNLQHVLVSFNGDNCNTLNIIVGKKTEESYQAFLPKEYTENELKQFEGLFYSEELDTKYELKIEGGILKALHPKIGKIELKPIKEDTFLSNGWQFQSLKFERGSATKIIGFRISSDRAKHVKFIK